LGDLTHLPYLHYNQTAKTGGLGAYICFNFTGTKIRLIATRMPTHSPSVSVYIDGIKEDFSCNGVGLYQCLLYEKNNLSNVEHVFKIVNNTTGVVYFDAIDIDEEGKLLPYSPKLVQTNLTATAGDSQVTLSWTAVSGATGYNVKRSTTAGGPYTTIATNVTGTTYVDKTVTNGTAYYYVVTAVDGSGNESANSNEAFATPVATQVPTGQALLRVTMLDSSEREYQLSNIEIDGFINWYNRTVGTGTTSYVLNKNIGLQFSKEYLAFDKIISFEVIPLTK
jgi:hypothetical protein